MPISLAEPDFVQSAIESDRRATIANVEENRKYCSEERIEEIGKGFNRRACLYNGNVREKTAR